MKRIENIAALTICLVFGVLGVFFVKAEDSTTTNSVSRQPSEIHFLNVGQGDAILFEQGDEQTLVDTGPDEAILTELGKVMPISDKSIETIIITHPHADHLGGLNYIFRAYSVERVYYNGVAYDSPQFDQFISEIRELQIPLERLYTGKKLTINELTLDVLWPPESLPITQDVNETSIVMAARFMPGRMLLTGDVSAKVLGNLSLTPVDILKVSHHGSKTGTDERLLRNTNPRYAVIMVGHNSYGHPAPSILTLLEGTRIFRTDMDGTTSFFVNPSGVFLY